MHPYEIAKLVHFIGIISLVGFFMFYSRAVPRMRAAKTLQEVRTWLGLLEDVRPMVPSGAVLILASGLVMSGLRWRTVYPFTVVGLTTVIVIWIVLATVGGRHVRAMRAAMERADGGVSVELSSVISDPRPWTIIIALNGAAIGVLVVMTTKVGWAVAIELVLATAISGAVIGSKLARGSQSVEAK